jgi:hypothetical protein
MDKYNSKIGLELILFIGGVLGFVSTMLIINLAWPGLIVVLAVIGFTLYLFKSILYTIDGNSLIITCGFGATLKVQIDKITKIKETYNPLSSPAASLDRIAIYYDKSGFVLLSPKKKMDFINRLIEINPKIEVILRKNRTT